MTEQELIEKLKNTSNVLEIINVINDKNATEEVYQKSIPLIDHYGYTTKESIFNEIINKT